MAVAIVALARKVLCLIHHLLVNQEMYEDNGWVAEKDTSISENKNQRTMTIEDMIQCIARAGYEVKKIKSGMGE
jgi:transposase